MQSIFTSLCLLLTMSLWAQTTVTFESFNLSEGEFLNGSTLMMGESGFEAGNALFINDFNAAYNAFNGWAISADTDTQTAGFTNQYSSITGGGYDGSDSYAVAYAFNGSTIHLTGPAGGGVVSGFYITNSTYAYLSMLEGDGVAKKFGGETGNDPDFLLLTVQKWYEGELSNEQVDFYLADYRFDNNEEDYIVDDWQFVDLSSMGNVDSLLFTMTSTDVGNYGINTPLYFCIDNFTTLDVMSNTNDLHPGLVFDVYPNPVVDLLRIESPVYQVGIWEIYNQQGQRVERGNFNGTTQQLQVGSLPTGSYLLRLATEEGWSIQRFIKK